MALSLTWAAGGVAFAFASGVGAIAAAAFVDMVNGMGRERDASLIVDQAILPATGSDVERTTAFAWYDVAQDAGQALGSLFAALPTVVRYVVGVNELAAFRAAPVVCASILLVTAAVYARLSGAVERPAGRGMTSAIRASPESRCILWKISSLFAVDGVAGEFLTTALLSFAWLGTRKGKSFAVTGTVRSP